MAETQKTALSSGRTRRRVRLGDICTVVSGSTPKTSVKEYWGGTIRWVTPAEIKDDTHWLSDTVKHITREGFKSANLTMMPAGTVLLSSRAPIGKVAITAEPMCCNQGFKNLVCSGDVISEYLFWHLKAGVQQLKSLGRGATFKELSKSAVENYEIWLPPISKQKAIASHFSEIDALETKLTGTSAHLDTLIKSRFIEMFGDPIDAVSNYRLGDLADMKAGSATTSNDIVSSPGPSLYPCFGGNGLRGYSKSPTHDGIYPLIGRQGALCGNVQIARGTFRATEHAVVVDCGGKCNPEWLYHFLRLDDLGRLSSGAAQPGLSVKNLKRVPIKLPAQNEQEEFVHFATETDKLRFDVQQQIEKLEILKKSLMQEYFG